MYIFEVCPGILQADADGARQAYQDRATNGIGGILNVTDNIEQEYPEVHSFRLRIAAGCAIPPQWFDQAINFQKGISATGKKTLVHCDQSLSRSTCLVAAMMFGWGESVDSALGKLHGKQFHPISIGSLRAWAVLKQKIG